MSSQEHNMVVLDQIVKHIPGKLIEKLKNEHKIQTRAFSATSHVVSMLFAQMSHALSLNDICDCLRFHKGYLDQIRDCVPPSRNGLAHANATRDAVAFQAGDPCSGLHDDPVDCEMYELGQTQTAESRRRICRHIL